MSIRPAPGPLRPFHFPAFHRDRLPNGLAVLVAELPQFPVATLMLVLPAGAEAEDERRGGLASLVAELLESGAGGRNAAEIAEALERLGLSFSATASWDATQASVTGLSNHLDAGAALLADLIRAPSFPRDEVERLRDERLAEISQRRADPGGLASEMALRFIFAPGESFARPLGGTPATVGRIVRGDVVGFHADRYTPGGATLVVAGDVAPDAAFDLARRYFGDWGGAPGPVTPGEVRPRDLRRHLVVVDRPGSVQSEIRVGHVGVPRHTDDHFPILVMNGILGGIFASRLNLNLRERHGFTYGISSAFAMRRRPGPFLISTAVQSDATAPALAEILREIERLREQPVSGEELDDARNYLAGVFPLRLETTDGVAAHLAELAIYDLPDDHFERYRERIRGVSAEQVLRAAREHLHPDRLALIVVGDASVVVEPLRQLGAAPVEVVSAREVENSSPNEPASPGASTD